MYTSTKIVKHYQTPLNIYKEPLDLKPKMIANGIKKYTVQEVADFLGIYRGTVINYEKKGVFPRARRNPINDYREYTEEDIDHLKKIIEGKIVNDQ